MSQGRCLQQRGPGVDIGFFDSCVGDVMIVIFDMSSFRSARHDHNKLHEIKGRDRGVL